MEVIEHPVETPIALPESLKDGNFSILNNFGLSATARTVMHQLLSRCITERSYPNLVDVRAVLKEHARNPSWLTILKRKGLITHGKKRRTWALSPLLVACIEGKSLLDARRDIIIDGLTGKMRTLCDKIGTIHPERFSLPLTEHELTTLTGALVIPREVLYRMLRELERLGLFKIRTQGGIDTIFFNVDYTPCVQKRNARTVSKKHMRGRKLAPSHKHKKPDLTASEMIAKLKWEISEIDEKTKELKHLRNERTLLIKQIQKL